MQYNGKSLTVFFGVCFSMLTAHALPSQLRCKLFIEEKTQALGMGTYPQFNENFRMVEGQNGSYRILPQSEKDAKAPFHIVRVTSTDTKTWQDVTIEEVTEYDFNQISPIRKSTAMTYKFHQPDCGVELITKIETKRPGANGSTEEITSESVHANMCQSIRNGREKYKEYFYSSESHVNEAFTNGAGFSMSSLDYGYKSGNPIANKERLQKLALLCKDVPLMPLDPPAQDDRPVLRRSR